VKDEMSKRYITLKAR